MLLTYPVRVPIRRCNFKRKLVKASWQEGVQLAGKTLGLFVLFTSTANWWFYRKIRKDHEDKPK